MTGNIFPAVDEPITVGFLRNVKRIRRGKQDALEFLYNGGWIHVEVSQTDFYDRPTHLKITGKDNQAYRVNVSRRMPQGSANLWHDLKKLADPDYNHPFETGMGDKNIEHPFHNPGPKPMRVR